MATTSSVSARGKKGGKKGKRGGGSPHIDYLAYFSYGLGGLLVLIGGLLIVVGGGIATAIGGEGSGYLLTFFTILGAFFLLTSLPMFAAGYGLQQRASWGRILTLVLAVLNALGGLSSFNPVQIGFAVYAFIVLLDKDNAAAFR